MSRCLKHAEVACVLPTMSCLLCQQLVQKGGSAYDRHIAWHQVPHTDTLPSSPCPPGRLTVASTSVTGLSAFAALLPFLPFSNSSRGVGGVLPLDAPSLDSCSFCSKGTNEACALQVRACHHRAGCWLLQDARQLASGRAAGIQQRSGLQQSGSRLGVSDKRSLLLRQHAACCE